MNSASASGCLTKLPVNINTVDNTPKLGEIDRLFGVPATTRSWNTISAIANVLGHREIRAAQARESDVSPLCQVFYILLIKGFAKRIRIN